MKFKGIILVLSVLILSGCALPEEEAWTPWCDYRGFCHLRLCVQVDSRPSGAHVYLDQDLAGTTPCTVVLQAAPVITGQKRVVVSPAGENTVYLVRDSRYHGQTSRTLRVTKPGYVPLVHTVVVEDVFPAEALLHEKIYEKSVSMVFELEEDGSPSAPSAQAP